MIFFGGHLIELWQKEGVNHSQVNKIRDASTGIYFVTYDSNGHNFSYFREDSVVSKITPGSLPSTYIASDKINGKVVETVDANGNFLTEWLRHGNPLDSAQ